MLTDKSIINIKLLIFVFVTNTFYMTNEFGHEFTSLPQNTIKQPLTPLENTNVSIAKIKNM